MCLRTELGVSGLQSLGALRFRKGFGVGEYGLRPSAIGRAERFGFRIFGVFRALGFQGRYGSEGARVW